MKKYESIVELAIKYCDLNDLKSFERARTIEIAACIAANIYLKNEIKTCDHPQIDIEGMEKEIKDGISFIIPPIIWNLKTCRKLLI